ncbi:early endosome antigen 1-like isoform X2 [Hibiscus syriacus]|uniref:early endosome antigen 1-like isoform X2 n=1 Tax=Hibiscus syriacus TaxID=106335 RepID=UPI001924E13E|nr:early endosome antigen 1-like isoform X2 [Hibiscus syriacus]
METGLNDTESLLARIKQLEHDIEQLCMQQAGPSYLGVATRMHFQRTAGLEQEIENLRKELAACTRHNQNLQEELSESYRIKTQLADLHREEAAKNLEAEKQVKYFQGCVAAAFAERDRSILEAEKAKEKEELMAQKYNEFQARLEELASNCLEQSRCNDALQIDLAKQKEENGTLKKVIGKFYEIRQETLGELEDSSLDDKCTCLLNDPAELWSFNDSSTAKYISSLEAELERVRRSVDDLRNKLRMGLEIENHLKKKFRELERKKITSGKMILNRVTELRHYHSEQKIQIMNLLDMERSHIKRSVDAVEEKIRQVDPRGQNVHSVLKPDEDERVDVHTSTDAEEKIRQFNPRGHHVQCFLKPDEDGRVVVHISTDAESKLVSKGVDLNTAENKGDASEALSQALQEKRDLLDSNTAETKLNASEALAKALQEKRGMLDLNTAETKGDASEALAQALQEKVAALLLLSQQEERHLLEKNVNAALQKKIDELHRNLLQVTNEKVKALLELAQFKRRYQLLQQKISNEMKQGNVLAEVADRRVVTYEKDGKLKNLLKKTYLKRWVGALDAGENEAESPPNSIDFVRLRIENATLKESMESIDLLTSTVHRLRLSLLKVMELINSKDSDTSSLETLDEIITEAKLVKTTLGSSLPVTWSAEGDVEPIGESIDGEASDMFEDSSSQKIYSVSAAGFEMLDLLTLAAQILKETPRTCSSSTS